MATSRQSARRARLSSSRMTRNGLPGRSRAFSGRTATRWYGPTPASRRSSGHAPRNPTSSSSTRRCRTCTGSTSAARCAAILASAHDTDRHHHLGALGPNPASGGLPLRRVGIPRAAARRRGASAQARHVPRSPSVQVDILREENLLDSGTGLYNMRGLARRAREIGADATAPPRGARLRRVRAGDRSSTAMRLHQDEMARLSDQVGVLFRRRRPRLGRHRSPRRHEFAVIAPATGRRWGASPGEPVGRRSRGHPDSGPRWRALGASQGRILRGAGLRGVRGGCHGTPASCNDCTSGSQAGGRRRPHPGLRTGVPAVPHLARTSL